MASSDKSATLRHTRQLDMIMPNPAQIDYCDRKLRRGIEGILAGKVRAEGKN